jgi:predicted DNA-binding ribbon-helix-helix protein
MLFAGHKTSVSLEDAFWDALREIATARGVTTAALVSTINTNRQHGNLSSAIRLFVLDHYRARSLARRLSLFVVSEQASTDIRSGPSLRMPPLTPVRTTTSPSMASSAVGPNAAHHQRPVVTPCARPRPDERWCEPLARATSKTSQSFRQLDFRFADG